MKRLTVNRIARAGLKFHRKAYLSLLAGIFLAVYLACATCLCLWGMLQAQEAQMARQVGWMDAILPDTPNVTDEQMRSSGLFERIGHVYVTASVQDSEIYMGYYDDTASEMLNRSCTEGRFPQAAGEIAAERSALDKLGLESATLGDTLTWDVQPLDGEVETQTFLLVGILNEQSMYLNQGFLPGKGNMPALLTFPEEAATAHGRLAVHRVMTTRPLVTLTQIQNYGNGEMYACCRVSRVSGASSYMDDAVYERSYQLQQTLLRGMLGMALLLSACVGIASAMESMLARKAEDIGMLRAVGATRRQIRRIFGRDAWLLALTALPVGAAMGCLTCWLLSRLMPERMLFRPTPWLLLPVLAISFLCVLLSSALPLRRASQQSPMGVLRDTGTLRRAMRIRSSQTFRPTQLITGRQLRLHPFRQAGSACMVALMLLCSTLLGGILYVRYANISTRQEAFSLSQTASSVSVEADAFSHFLDDHRLTSGDLAQIRSLPLVRKLRTSTLVTVNLLLPDGIPDYLQTHTFPVTNERGDVIGESFMLWTKQDNRYLLLDQGLTEEDFGHPWNYTFAQKTALQMHALQQASGVSDPLTPFALRILTLEAGDLAENVVEGRIDLEALDAGREVLVYAPNQCFKSSENGRRMVATDLYFDDQLDPEQWDLILQNDYFYAGQELSLLQVSGRLPDDLPATDDEAQLLAYYEGMNKVSFTPRVGAVLKGAIHLDDYFDGFSLITTEKGAQALGVQTAGVDSAAVMLDADPALAVEESLEASLKRIAMRRDMTCTNLLKSAREAWAELYETVLLLGGILALFFAVSAAMQISEASRRIQADERMIGTLRAAGADEHALLGCYRLPVFLSAGTGLLIALAVTVGMVLAEIYPLSGALTMVLPAMVLLAALNALCALAGIRARLQQVTGRSIVENIREL